MLDVRYFLEKRMKLPRRDDFDLVIHDF